MNAHDFAMTLASAAYAKEVLAMLKRGEPVQDFQVERLAEMVIELTDQKTEYTGCKGCGAGPDEGCECPKEFDSWQDI